jgi:hypothetical protein
MKVTFVTLFTSLCCLPVFDPDAQRLRGEVIFSDAGYDPAAQTAWPARQEFSPLKCQLIQKNFIAGLCEALDTRRYNDLKLVPDFQRWA